MSSYIESWERYQTWRKAQPTCRGCRHLRSELDGAGGGTWFCERHPGVVVGEWGWWEKGDQEPRRLSEDCFEPRR